MRPTTREFSTLEASVYQLISEIQAAINRGLKHNEEKLIEVREDIG